MDGRELADSDTVTDANRPDMVMLDAAELDRVLTVVEEDVVPLTRQGVADGNKLFGAAIVDRETLDLVVAGTNAEVENPLFHGEISALNRFWALSSQDRPAPRRCLFISTHEPCSLCLSAITWSGFDAFVYLFTYEDSRDEFAIPHDLDIMREVFKLDHGDYNHRNAYWAASSIGDLVADCGPAASADLNERIAGLHRLYAELSGRYQATKSDSPIPLA